MEVSNPYAIEPTEAPLDLADAELFEKVAEAFDWSQEALDDYPKEIGDVVRVYCFHGTIFNGGLAHWFENDEAWFGRPTLDALHRVGLPGLSSTLQKAYAFFPTEADYEDGQRRWQIIQANEEAIGELDDDVMERFDSQTIQRHAADYIRTNWPRINPAMRNAQAQRPKPHGFGRALVIIACSLMLLTSVAVIVLYQLNRGADRLPAQLIRFALTGVLCWRLYQGRAWARWVTTILLGVAILLLADTMRRQGPLPEIVVLTTIYGLVIALLWIGPGVGQHFRRRQTAQEATGL